MRGGCHAPRGQTPVAFAVGGTRQKLSMISTVTQQEKARRRIIDANFNADKLIEFLDALTPVSGRKVFLMLDSLRLHPSKPVKAWREENKEQIEVFYRPGYSLPWNPDERRNADFKYAAGSTVAMRSTSPLWDAATESMTMLETSPERIQSYFPDPRVQYAAWRLHRSGSIGINTVGIPSPISGRRGFCAANAFATERSFAPLSPLWERGRERGNT